MSEGSSVAEGRYSEHAHGGKEAQTSSAASRIRDLRELAEREPLDVDISDYGDEWCAGFLRGQAHALDLALNDLDRMEALVVRLRDTLTTIWGGIRG